MTLIELLEKIENVQTNDTRLYFITRLLKENIKKSSKVLDRYLFKVYQVDVDDEIRQHLYDLTNEQLEYVIKKDFEIVDYDVVSDDTEHLFTYSMKNKAMSFSDVVCNQLDNKVPRISSIEEIISDNEELWAYCVGFNDIENKDWIYTFRKIQPGKIALDENENTKSKLKIIRTFFSTKSKKLELLKGETINLDKQIDCVYYDEIFYILKRGYFEQIVGLQEEYKVEAKNVVEELRKLNIIEGLDIIEKQIENKPAIHKKLVRISRIGNYRNVDEKTIKKMQTVCKKYGDKLNVKNGKLQIDEDKDVDVILKMLADYYKTGEVSGKAYGTYAGKQLKENTLI
ncbi:hypothetical protein AQPE_4006 [Aquipluma nitroreducens]|uniref:DUF4868 domain-containing protein n=1 Tax=Aquipluma nitroreducens TaxID=2010828 RepID=A0A5K7SE20_9BACT|nr:Kiwa anti-phage protein KwaB-like domain-containing protein [Aquipluma nitroreducens]BBE19818.1 hypothetical protein AQPE_4006 [Aquipluma nitroreducens]